MPTPEPLIPLNPPRLQVGDTVAVATTSWGGPHMFPHVFDAGVRNLRERFGLNVIELSGTRRSVSELRNDPQGRAADLNQAFADPSIKAIFMSIGGDDSARILPFLDVDLIRSNPKILMGYSDSVTQLVFAHAAGLVTFNGPSVMAGFAQLAHFPEWEAHIRAILFEPTDSYVYTSFPHWIDAYDDWNDPANDGRIGAKHAHDGWRWLGGTRARSGRLFGGCIEVLEFLKGSQYWPEVDFWSDRILFLETSEEVPTIAQVRYWLFNYGVQGVFERVSGLIIGRARGYSDDQKHALEAMVVQVVVEEFGGSDVCILSNADLGHTDPQWIVPLGVRAELDPVGESFRLLEPAVS